MGACETTPATTHTGKPAPAPNPATHNQLALSPLPIIGRRLPGVQLVRPRPRPPGRQGLRALQLDPGPRDGTNPGSGEESQHHSPSPTNESHRVRSARALDKQIPMGADYGDWSYLMLPGVDPG